MLVALDEARENPAELVGILRVIADVDDGACLVCGETGHNRVCQVAKWLRVFGGEAEVQRQTDQAHLEAIRNPWLYPKPLVGGSIITGLRAGQTISRGQWVGRPIGGGDIVVPTNSTDDVFGVVLNDAVINQMVEVRIGGGYVPEVDPPSTVDGWIDGDGHYRARSALVDVDEDA